MKTCSTCKEKKQITDFYKHKAYKDGGGSNSPSLDRIDSDKGYIKGNIQIINWRANTLKNNATKQEILLLAAFLKEMN